MSLKNSTNPSKSGSAIFWISILVFSYRALIGQVIASEEPKAKETPIERVGALVEQRTQAFNSHAADAVAAFFHEDGEFIDEFGNHYQGKEEIKNLLATFYERFPGIQMINTPDSIRAVGPIVIEEGIRVTMSADQAISQVRYIAIHVQESDRWQIASLRDIDDSPPPTPGEMLSSLEWILGEWVNEGSDAKVHLVYRWSDDRNFIVGDIDVHQEGVIVAKSSHRIGWDAAVGKFRSWLFDSDGGFGGGYWTELEDRWMIQCSASLPDGTAGSATLTLKPLSSDRFSITGTNRLVGDVLEEDFELIVVRKPPSAVQK